MILAQSLLVLLLIGFSLASKMFYEAKVGDRVVLDIGRDVVTWKRVRHNDREEFIKHCKDGDNDPRCNGFVTKDNKPAIPASNARVDAEGKLILNPFEVTDVGLYSSPDQKPLEESHDGGVVSAVLNKHIVLMVKE